MILGASGKTMHVHLLYIALHGGHYISIYILLRNFLDHFKKLTKNNKEFNQCQMKTKQPADEAISHLPSDEKINHYIAAECYEKLRLNQLDSSHSCLQKVLDKRVEK